MLSDLKNIHVVTTKKTSFLTLFYSTRLEVLYHKTESGIIWYRRCEQKTRQYKEQNFFRNVTSQCINLLIHPYTPLS